MRECAFFLQNLLKVFLKSESSGLAWRAKKLFFCLLIRSKREREREQERERTLEILLKKRDSHR